MTIEITRFCQRPSGHCRSYLTKPWSIGAWTYATNGHMAIRVPRRDDVPENPEAPASIETIFAADDGATYTALPEIKIPRAKLPRCDKCNGARFGDKCGDCNGTGSHECTCGDEHECGECDGSGIIGWRARADIPEAERHYCVECGGLGHERDKRKVIFTDIGLCLDVTYVAEVLRLPGPVLMAVQPKQPDRLSGREEHVSPVLFRCDEAVACIMPLLWSSHIGIDDIQVRANVETEPV